MASDVNRVIKIKQVCEVCDEEGIFSPGRIKIIGMPDKHERPVGQCPACEKFFCARHAEKVVSELDQEELSQFRDVIRKSGAKPQLLLCPLDLRVPLGDAGKQGVVVVSEDVKELSSRPDGEERKPGDAMKEPLAQPRSFFSRLRGVFGRKRPPG